MCQDHAQFVERNAEIIAIGPDGPNAFKRYWGENNIPFSGCPDIGHKIADQYHQEVNLFKFGRMPAIFVIDHEGKVRYSHFGDSMADIPENSVILKILEDLRQQP